MNAAAISLTRGLVALVDHEDVARVAGFSWCASPRPRPKGAVYATRSGRGGGEPATVYMHRIILGAKCGELVDHINGNTLDNRRDNLRLCTASQNSANSRQKVGASGFRGVTASTNPTGKPWRACIFHGRKKISLGYFECSTEAAMAYDAAAAVIFGEFAKLNFPKAA